MPRRWRRIRISLVATAFVGVTFLPGCDAQQAQTPPQLTKAPARDTYRITLDASIADELQAGRLLVFFITEQHGVWEDRSPSFGPFEEAPQPLAAVEVADLAPGTSFSFDQTLADTMPRSLDALS